MIGRMPILGEDDIAELRTEAVDQGNNLVTARYGEIATWAKVILDIDDNQNVGRSD